MTPGWRRTPTASSRSTMEDSAGGGGVAPRAPSPTPGRSPWCHPLVLNRPMDYRSLGKSGLKVSALSLGTMTFGGGGKFAFVGDTDAKEAKKQLDMAIAAGVNLVDTANVYSDGASETIVGEIVKGRRDDLLL